MVKDRQDTIEGFKPVVIVVNFFLQMVGIADLATQYLQSYSHFSFAFWKLLTTALAQEIGHCFPAFASFQLLLEGFDEVGSFRQRQPAPLQLVSQSLFQNSQRLLLRVRRVGGDKSVRKQPVSERK